MAIKFDSSKPYGEITGDSQGRRYIQDGVYFDAAGNPVGTEPVPVEKPAAKKKAAEA